MDDFPSWQEGIRREYAPLHGVRQADVVIVGGGLTGAACAALLSEAGVDVALLEARRLGRGDAWACTGKVTAQVSGLYTTIHSAIGQEAAAAYARLLREAVAGVRGLVEKHRIPCGLEDQTVHVYAEAASDVPALEKLLDLETRLGLPVAITPDMGGLPFPAALSIGLNRQLLLYPVPYLLGLIYAAQRKGARIYERSPVRQIEPGRVITPGGSVEADVVILATGSPVGCTSIPLLSMLQQRACQVTVLSSDTPLLNSHLSVQPDEMTLRPIPGGAVIAWDMGRTGSKRHPERQRRLEHTLRTRLPEMRVTDSYLRQDNWSGDGLPLIGPMRREDSRLLIATGYSGWGVANAYLAAKMLTAQILGQPIPEAALLQPDRHYTGKASVMFRGGIPIMGGYLGGLMRPAAPTCTHMGGKLRYNDEAMRWECPCHGSTFTVLGETLEGPALRDAEVSAKQR